jgi:hypothetical protein
VSKKYGIYANKQTYDIVKLTKYVKKLNQRKYSKFLKQLDKKYRNSTKQKIIML